MLIGRRLSSHSLYCIVLRTINNIIFLVTQIFLCSIQSCLCTRCSASKNYGTFVHSQAPRKLLYLYSKQNCSQNCRSRENHITRLLDRSESSSSTVSIIGTSDQPRLFLGKAYRQSLLSSCPLFFSKYHSTQSTRTEYYKRRVNRSTHHCSVFWKTKVSIACQDFMERLPSSRALSVRV